MKQAYRRRTDVADVIRAHTIAHNNKLLKYQQAAIKLRLRYHIFIIGRSIRTSTHNLTLGRIFSTFQSTNYLTVRLNAKPVKNHTVPPCHGCSMPQFERACSHTDSYQTDWRAVSYASPAYRLSIIARPTLNTIRYNTMENLP